MTKDIDDSTKSIQLVEKNHQTLLENIQYLETQVKELSQNYSKNDLSVPELLVSFFLIIPDLHYPIIVY